MTDDLAADLVGCSAIKRSKSGPVCELPENRNLRIILPAGARDASASADGAPASFEPIRDQTALSVTVPPGAASLVVEATVANKRARARYRLGNADKLSWLGEARIARAKGDLDRAGAIATEHKGDPTPLARALARGLLARIALSRGRADEAFPLFREAIELHRGADRVSDAVDDSFALAFALHQRSQRYTEARAVLDSLTAELPLYPEGRARAPYYRGSLAAETGDRRSALSLFHDAEHAAKRLGMTRLERNARSALALEMQEIGRARASLPILAALEKELDEAAKSGGAGESPSACERVEIANNRGWGALLAKESDGAPAGDDARASLERALAIEGCADAYVRGFALSNLARLAVDEGDLKAAEQRLAEARAGVKEPRGTERVGWLELEGRILLGRDRAGDALRVFDEALAIARASVLPPQEWSLLVSRAEALVALRRRSDAVASLRSAEDVLDSAILLVPLGEGRGAFAGGRSRSARALLGLLVKENRPLEAAAVAERAHARVLASALGILRLERLGQEERARWEETVRAFRAARAAIDADAANDWKLPADALAVAVKSRLERERELRAVLERALALLGGTRPERRAEPAATSRTVELDIHPDLQGFVAIAKHDGTATAYRLPPPGNEQPDALSRALIDPISGLLERASSASSDSVLVVRAWGGWRTVDIHALPWRGEPLMARIPIVYSVGLGSSEQPSGSDTLVIGDPTSDLPAALDEARAVARKLREDVPDSGGGGVRLLVRDEATSKAVTDGLHHATRLHYAGHGVFAGEEGWESALPLAAGSRLTAPDILALAPAPRSVVLTGCDAAKSTGEAEGLGLAQAFVVAGSAEVLAPVRPVPDSLAARMAAALYPTRSLSPLPARAREAVLALRRDAPSSDWAAFRVLVP